MKHLAALGLAVGLFAVVAIGTATVDNPTKINDSLLFGQSQAYSAVVRPDGKVITYAKIFLNNSHDSDLESTSFSLPEGVDVSNLSIYQVLLPDYCTDEKKETPKTPADPYDYSYLPTCDNLADQVFNADGYGYYGYSDASLRYKTVEPTINGHAYQFDLPEAIKPHQRGAYLVAYMATGGYVTNAMGIYHLSFKTLTVPQSVNQVRVSVDVASDFYTRVQHSSIGAAEKGDPSLASGVASADKEFSNASLDQLQGGIGSGGTFTKTGKSLLPGETFIVSGDFADAKWKLYWKELAGGLAVFIVVLGLTVFFLKRAEHSHTVITRKGRNHGKK